MDAMSNFWYYMLTLISISFHECTQLVAKPIKQILNNEMIRGY